MLAYIVRRTVSMVAVLICISLVTFVVAYAVPGDPARVIVGMHASSAVVAEVRHNLGLDKPIFVQYLIYMGNLLGGNLGFSYVNDMPVLQLIGGRLGNTALLALGGWLVEIAIGLPLGVITAVRHRTVSDFVISILTLVGISLPSFWFGMWLIYNIAYKAGILPVGGTGGFKYLVLPAVTLGVTGAAVYQRLLKTSMLDVLDQDYIRTAHASGVNLFRVIYHHTFRNAVIPAFTYAGMDIAGLLGGVVLVETVFNYPGIGLLALQSIQNMDIPVIMGTVLLTAVFVVLANFIVDLLYVVIDPRISYS